MAGSAGIFDARRIEDTFGSFTERPRQYSVVLHVLKPRPYTAFDLSSKVQRVERDRRPGTWRYGERPRVPKSVPNRAGVAIRTHPGIRRLRVEDGTSRAPKIGRCHHLPPSEHVLSCPSLKVRSCRFCWCARGATKESNSVDLSVQEDECRQDVVGELPGGRILIRQQLLSGGDKPIFIPTKGKRARTIDLAPETVELLKAHKRHQAALKLRHRQEYHDHGLVFTKEWDDGGEKYGTLGQPLSVNNLGQREFARLIKAAKVKVITLHGLRHTCASLLLSAGVQPNVVQQRLGHKRIEITLDVYAHVLPGQQRDAARRLGSILYG